jgi:Tol biopolymer transport system component
MLWLFALVPLIGAVGNTPAAQAQFPGHNGFFVAANGPSHHLILLDKNAANPNTLVSIPTNADYPSFTPNGKAVVFDAPGAVTEAIFRVPTGGGTASQLTHGSVYSWGSNQGPNGLIVYVCEKPDDEICTMKANGSNVTQITHNSDLDWNPKFSPNGSRITFSSDRDGDQEIFSMDVDGSHVRQLTHNSTGDFEPDYSPNGKKIAYWSDATSPTELVVMNADGSNPLPIASPHGARTPSWAPNGTLIAFAGDTDDQIYTVQPNGSGLVQLGTSGSGNNISWQPRP